MSATTLRDPLVVRLQDGSSWVQRAVMQDGHGLYVLEGSVDDCPLQVMAPFRELAELGLASVTDGQPEPSVLQQVSEEIARFGIYGGVLPATRALVKRADELVNEAARLRASLKDACDQIAELESDLGGASIRVAELERLLEAKDRPVDEDPIRFELTAAADEAVRRSVDAQFPIVAAFLAEDPHDSPLHHDYRVSRDLPETGGAR